MKNTGNIKRVGRNAYSIWKMIISQKKYIEAEKEVSSILNKR